MSDAYPIRIELTWENRLRHPAGETPGPNACRVKMMCGATGEVRLDGQAPDVSAVSAMAEAMAPRGPDAAGVWSQGRVALGHRRLKIIDLTEAGAQPMVDSELGLTVCWNGCIYNYRELRRELSGHGYRFFSHSDTEVLLKAYHHWGDRFVEHLKGMFAFAIWDGQNRDRNGRKVVSNWHQLVLER